MFSGLRSFATREWPFSILFCFFFISLVYWVYLDRTVPVWDSASHLIRTYELNDVLSSHGSFDKKLLAILTCGHRYPPLFNWVHYLFLVSPIKPTVVDQLPRFVFFAIGIISLYKLGCQLFNDRAVGLAATAIFFALPLVCVVSHTRGLIDMPLASMCFLALWLVARYAAVPSLTNSLVAGCAIGLACLTKQLGAVYLAPAICLVLIRRLLARDFGHAIQFSIGLGIAAIMLLAWLTPSLPVIKENISVWERDFASTPGTAPDLLTNLIAHIRGTIYCISVPVSILSVLSIFNFQAQRKLLLPAGTVFGLLFLCTLRWWPIEARYLLPFVGYLALSSAALLVRMWRSRWHFLKLVDITFAIYLLTIFFLFNFTPYPFARAGALAMIDMGTNGLGCCKEGVFPACPCPSEPLAYNWLLDQILSKHQNRSPVIVIAGSWWYFQAMPVLYLARQRGTQVQFGPILRQGITGLTQCTPDSVLLSPDWYVTLENSDEFERISFSSEQDRKNFYQLKAHFESPSDFTRVGAFELPDSKGSMVLYRARYPK